MLFPRRIHNGAQAVESGLALNGVIVVPGLAMRLCGLVERVLLDSGVGLLTRVPGLLLPAIAVQLVAAAVRAFVNQGMRKEGRSWRRG